MVAPRFLYKSLSMLVNAWRTETAFCLLESSENSDFPPPRAFSDFRSSCLSKEFFNYLYLPWCEHAQLVVVAHSFQCLPKSACQVYFLPEEPYGRPVGMVGIIEHGQATEGASTPPPSHFGERRARCVTVSIFCHRSFSLAGRNHRLSLGWGCA